MCLYLHTVTDNGEQRQEPIWEQANTDMHQWLDKHNATKPKADHIAVDKGHKYLKTCWCNFIHTYRTYW
jgi:hypothetical protein